MAKLNGVDVSRWQPTSILDVIPYDFAICKLTDGTGYVHVQDGLDKAAKVLAHGKLLGLYHFAENGDANAEADYFAGKAAPYIGKAILVLDYEAKALNNGREWVRAWVRRVAAKTGVTPMVYVSGSPAKTQDIIGLAKEEDFGIWVAAYPNNDPTGYRPDATQNYVPNPVMYQYSSTGRLAGYSGNLDLNVFYGDAAAWGRYAGGTEVKPTPAPAPAPTPAPTGGSTYTVVKGNTLSGIAKKYGTTYQELARINGIADPNKINVGQVIKLPSSSPAPAPTPAPTPAPAATYPAVSGAVSSIVDALKSIGVDGSLGSRKKIAAANGISGYSGTSAQNLQLLALLRQGKLKKV
ncbi:MAG: LysM peptidoglycan-binding domain-containing protein [Clostridiales Family XIII bacterium]|jgi:GH25 family lysozyme M1 (1,4-beta-N-acetylmuramidase)|nr:LysM peptidoglycan-binding domain-containing protein [Clostridiales Family XIII bacterium]